VYTQDKLDNYSLRLNTSTTTSEAHFTWQLTAATNVCSWF